MAKSLSKAFTYMFEDSDWKYKLFVAVMVTIPNTLSIYAGQNFKNMQLFDMSKLSELANLSSLSGMSNLTDYEDYTSPPATPSAADLAGISNLSHIVLLSIGLAIIASVASVILVGYYCKYTHNVINHDGQKKLDLLPSWEKDFWLYTKTGVLFSYGSSIAFALPVILLVLIYLTNPKSIVPLGIPCVIWTAFIAFSFVAMSSLFCIDFQPSSFLAYKKTIKLISHNILNYLKILITMFLLAAALVGIYLLLLHSQMFVVVFSIVQVYISLVFAYLLGAIFQIVPSKFFS